MRISLFWCSCKKALMGNCKVNSWEVILYSICSQEMIYLLLGLLWVFEFRSLLQDLALPVEHQSFIQGRIQLCVFSLNSARHWKACQSTVWCRRQPQSPLCWRGDHRYKYCLHPWSHHDWNAWSTEALPFLERPNKRISLKQPKEHIHELQIFDLSLSPYDVVCFWECFPPFEITPWSCPWPESSVDLVLSFVFLNVNNCEIWMEMAEFYQDSLRYGRIVPCDSKHPEPQNLSIRVCSSCRVCLCSTQLVLLQSHVHSSYVEPGRWP